MVEGVVVLAEGVFVGAEVRQPLAQKALQPSIGTLVVVGNPERPQLAGVAGEVLADQLAQRRFVGAGGDGRQGRLDVALGQLAAVVGIEAPNTTAGGAVGFQQQIEAPPLALVEGLHERAAPPLKPEPALIYGFKEGR